MKLLILGSTGSIGSFAIDLLTKELKGDFEVEGLSFHSNASLAIKQALAVKAKKVFTTSKEGYEEFKKLCPTIPVYFGSDAIKEECRNPEINVVLLAIVGFAGLDFAIESVIKEERILAIANKETIICGNHILNEKLKNSKTTIIPVDSEHNSLYRLFKGCCIEEVESVFITSSGGPFAGRKFHELTHVEIKDVLKHPVWNMGGKISIDSATMANKGLELIEAYQLFPFLKAGSVSAFISKGSLLHAGVYTQDGALSLFVSAPDMRLHIANAISGGKVKKLNSKKINPFEVSCINHEEIKQDEFPIFFTAKQVAESKDLESIISFNILNEIAVRHFLESKIKYTQILSIINDNLNYNPNNMKFNNYDEIKEYESFLQNYLTNNF